MTDQAKRGRSDRDGFGGDAGSPIDRPNATPDEDEAGRGRGSTASGGSSAHDAGLSETGAGGEAAESVREKGVGSRTHDHKGGYGGELGKPREPRNDGSS